MLHIKIIYEFSYSELVEIHRIDEATATPFEEGASLSELYSSNKRIEYRKNLVRLIVKRAFLYNILHKEGKKQWKNIYLLRNP